MCRKGETEKVKAALSGGVDPHMKEVGRIGRSAIHFAAGAGHQGVVAFAVIFYRFCSFFVVFSETHISTGNVAVGTAGTTTH